MCDEEVRQKVRSRSNSKARIYKSVNPYINFMGQYKKEEENIGLTGKVFFKKAGEKWKQLTPEEKAPFIEAAEKVRRQRDSDPAKPAKKKKSEKKKGNKKTKGNRSQSKSSKGKNASLKQSVCSKCGHRHGSIIDSFSRSRHRRRHHHEHNWNSRQRDANTSDSSGASDRQTYSSTSSASF